MAVHKATRPNSLAQPKPQHAKTARAGDPKPQRCRPHPHLKAELFDTLRQLNRGYGVALAALSRLGGDTNASPRFNGIFPAACLRDYRNRTEALRALANHDLLRLLAGREQQDAARFDRPSRREQTSPPQNRRS